MKLDLSAEGWGRVIVYTVLGTLVCVAAALFVDSFNFAIYDDATRTRAIIIDIVLPIALAVPLLLFLTGKLRELAIAHKKLTIYASTDGLTQVMNRAAFSTLVDAYLTQTRAAEEKARSGAFLIIDADNFKSVNDRFGHEKGDAALVTIARSIKEILRGPDLVGRLGGEEFGVFLPGATPEQAALVAERIRQSVNEAEFMPQADHHLSVSVGGAVFDRELPYAELFRLADQQLYAAKRDGRNRVAIAPIRPGPIALVAA